MVKTLEVSTATVQDFRKLYTITDVDAYADAKEAIFARYRKASKFSSLVLSYDAWGSK